LSLERRAQTLRARPNCSYNLQDLGLPLANARMSGLPIHALFKVAVTELRVS
jgi:hypothetical protein